MIQQIKNYKALETKRDTGHVVDIQDKGKKKETGINIKELVKTIQIHDSMSLSDIELEKRRKERDALAKRLEIAENEAAIAEMNNKIKFFEMAKRQSAVAPKGNMDGSYDNAEQDTTQVLLPFSSSF